MKYIEAPDLQEKAEDISRTLFPHIKIERMKCFRSYGSSSRGTIARCHALGKLMQLAVGVKAHYALEFISERFDKMPEEEQMKVIMHELMHIPKTFGGGFKHHDFVCEKNVNLFYKEYKKRKLRTSGGLFTTPATIDKADSQKIVLNSRDREDDVEAKKRARTRNWFGLLEE